MKENGFTLKKIKQEVNNAQQKLLLIQTKPMISRFLQRNLLKSNLRQQGAYFGTPTQIKLS